MLALPLAYIYARNVLVLSNRDTGQGDVCARSSTARAGNTIACCSSAAAAPTCCRRAGRHARWPANASSVPEYESARNAYPRGVRPRNSTTALYAFGPAVGRRPPDGSLDVGVNDDLNVIRFHAKEDDRRAHVPLVRAPVGRSSSAGSHPAARTLALWMSDGGRPAAAPAADVSLDSAAARSACCT